VPPSLVTRALHSRSSMPQDDGMTLSASQQGLVAVVPGVIVGVVVGAVVRQSLGPLAGYDTTVVFYLVHVWLTIWPMDAVASLGAVAVLIVQSHSSHGPIRGAEIGLGAGSVVVSWLLVHTLFTLKYARLYYGADEGGVDFEDHVRPPYSDFAYLAFTIGMTFQVSDTDLQTAEFRRLALRHELLSYLFGAVILASTINLVAGLAT
jgi:uncharacterized membrane protein